MKLSPVKLWVKFRSDVYTVRLDRESGQVTVWKNEQIWSQGTLDGGGSFDTRMHKHEWTNDVIVDRINMAIQKTF